MTLTKKEEKSLRAIVDPIEMTVEQGEAFQRFVVDYLTRWKKKIEAKLVADFKRGVGRKK